VNIQIKRAMLAAGIATAMALPLSSQASDGTITFLGAVTSNTCTVSVNGAGNTTNVTLPTVSMSALTNVAPRTTAAGTFFKMAVSGCTATPVNDYGAAGPPTTVQIYFEAGPNVDEATGGLINTAVGGSNVEVNLYNATSATVVGPQVMPGTSTGQPSTQLLATLATTTGTQWFYAGYSTAALAALTVGSAGAVSTSITYSLIYQ
jgi:major type 1 subunit fimbrin (pilin)